MEKYIELSVKGSEQELIRLMDTLKSAQGHYFRYSAELSNGAALNTSTPIEKVGCFVIKNNKK